MTEQDQIRAVAELDGWTNIFPRGRARELYGCNAGQMSHYEKIPPYLTSRDAIIAVIEKQPEEIIKKVCHIIWRSFLAGVVKNEYFSTASQLTEALLRATGKWKE